MQNPFRFGVGYSPLQSLFYENVIAAGTLEATRGVLQTMAETVPQHGSVLDVGCGGGQALLALARLRPDLELIGIDPSAALIRRAAGRAVPARSVTFLRAGAESLPFPTDRFSAVMSMFAVKHWPDPLVGLRECVRVTATGGPVMVAEIDASADVDRWRQFVDLTRMPSFLAGVYAHATLGPIVRRAMRSGQLRQLLGAAGAADVRVDPDPCRAILVGRGSAI